MVFGYHLHCKSPSVCRKELRDDKDGDRGVFGESTAIVVEDFVVVVVIVVVDFVVVAVVIHVQFRQSLENPSPCMIV